MKQILKKNKARTARALRVRRGIIAAARRPRLSVFRSNTAMYVQIIDDAQGKTLASASFKELAAKGKKPVEKAMLLGKTIAEKAKKAGITEVVFDRGMYAYHGRVKAIADGAREGGLSF